MYTRNTINTDDYYNCRHELNDYSPDEQVDECLYCDLCEEMHLSDDVISHEYNGVQYEVCNTCIAYNIEEQGVEVASDNEIDKILTSVLLDYNKAIKSILDIIAPYYGVHPSVGIKDSKVTIKLYGYVAGITIVKLWALCNEFSSYPLDIRTYPNNKIKLVLTLDN